jgi:hypothetical protein
MIPAANSSALTVSREREGEAAALLVSAGMAVGEGGSPAVRLRTRVRTDFVDSECVSDMVNLISGG